MERVSKTMIVSNDLVGNSPYKEFLKIQENKNRHKWTRKPYSGTIAEPKGSGSEIKEEENGL